MAKDEYQEDVLQSQTDLNQQEEQSELREERLAAEQRLKETLKKIEETAREEAPKPSQHLSLRTILGGDLLSTQMVRSQIWLFVLIVVFTIVYVAFRYQCQQDLLTIAKLEEQLKDAKFKALSSSSMLTEKCRESRVLDILKQRHDSLLHQADPPPYIIKVPE